MSDYIKREDAIVAVEKFGGRLNDEVLYEMKSALFTLPSADVVEARHGRWEIIYKHSEIATLVKCSECGHERYIQTGEEVNYCPYCGARMDGEEE